MEMLNVGENTGNYELHPFWCIDRLVAPSFKENYEGSNPETLYSVPKSYDKHFKRCITGQDTKKGY